VSEYSKKIAAFIADLGLEEIATQVQEALDSGEDPHSILKAMSKGMITVGELYEKGEYYLAELVLAGEVMKEGLTVLQPHLKTDNRGKKGTVVLCTVKGDTHDIGKNLVGNMLSSCGFNVIDLGVDVNEQQIVKAIQDHNAKALALSVLLTPMVDSIADVVAALSAAGIREKVKIAIGGACTTPELAKRMGVDAIGRDPVEAVKIFESFF